MVYFEFGIYFLCGYTVLLFLLPKSTADKLFDLQLTNEKALEFIRYKVKILESKKDVKSVRTTHKISKLLTKKYNDDIKLEKIKSTIQSYYFNNYNKRFCGFKKANLGLQLLIIWSGLGGFLIYAFLVLLLANQNDLTMQESIPFVLLSSLLIFIVPLCFSLLITFGLYAWFGILKTILNMVFGARSGKLHRTQMILETHILAFKPGGRNTKITFSELNNY